MSRRLSWVIHTAPSMVARQIAPCRWAMSSPRAIVQQPFAVGAEQVKLAPANRVEHAGIALAGADLAQNRVRAVGSPVDRAVVLGHERPRPAKRRRPEATVVAARARGHQPDRLAQRIDRGTPDLVPIEAGLAGIAHREGAAREHLTGVELVVGEQDGHPPLIHAEVDRPVERRGSAVAARTGMHDLAVAATPDRLGDQGLEERADDQLRIVLCQCRLHRCG